MATLHKGTRCANQNDTKHNKRAQTERRSEQRKTLTGKARIIDSYEIAVWRRIIEGGVRDARSATSLMKRAKQISANARGGIQHMLSCKLTPSLSFLEVSRVAGTESRSRSL